MNLLKPGKTVVVDVMSEIPSFPSRELRERFAAALDMPEEFAVAFVESGHFRAEAEADDPRHSRLLGELSRAVAAMRAAPGLPAASDVILIRSDLGLSIRLVMRERFEALLEREGKPR